ncbi:MAG: hypothetical protein N2440_02500 [Actinobacteria bacterium]|nr:hypothetical protein [Actinomycetota bacterium]
MSNNSFAKIEKALLSLENLSQKEIENSLEFLYEEEKRLSKKRRELHLKIDETRKEILLRLKNQKRKVRKEVLENLVKSLLNPILNLPKELLVEDERNPDLTVDVKSLNFEEIENYYNQLREEEALVSFKRRLVQGKIDLLKNWLSLKQTMQEGASDEEFARTLTKLLSEKGF